MVPIEPRSDLIFKYFMLIHAQAGIFWLIQDFLEGTPT